MNEELSSLLRSIEKLRQEMIGAYKISCNGLTSPYVLELSQKLDYLLNCYDTYKTKIQPAS